MPAHAVLSAAAVAEEIMHVQDVGNRSKSKVVNGAVLADATQQAWQMLCAGWIAGLAGCIGAGSIAAAYKSPAALNE